LVDLNNPEDTIFSERSILTPNEQILPEYGISVSIGQYEFPLNDPRDLSSNPTAGLLSDNISFSGPNPGWLSGVPDTEGNNLFNWIRSGTSQVGDSDDEGTGFPCFILDDGFSIANIVFEDEIGIDDRQVFENVVSGTVAPARLAASYNCGLAPLSGDARAQNKNGSSTLTSLTSLDLQFTRDKSKWTRGPVFETHWDPNTSENGGERTFLRRALSVDKNGRTQLDPGANVDEATYFGQQVLTQDMVNSFGSDADDILSAIQEEYPEVTSLVGLSLGMSWFPGYAINPETGERMNVGFGENSSLPEENGTDMIWNPTNNLVDFTTGELLAGGQHYVYVFRNDALRDDRTDRVPMYEGGTYIFNSMYAASPSVRRTVYRGMDWIAFPLLSDGVEYLTMEEGLLPGDARVKVDIGRPYRRYATTATPLGEGSLPFTPVDEELELSENNWYPFYSFSTEGIETITNDRTTAENALSMIDVVPNPYYAYSAYETSRVDNRVKFVNLPQECTIRIFTMNGVLIRILEKDNPQTFLEWDLQNEAFIPIAGGMYLVHIQSPGLGERVVKFFAATRPTDLRNF
jgi:hypothetical protein